MPPKKVAKMLARIMGIAIILLGLIAFLPNPLIGSIGYFRTDLLLNSVLLLFGLILLGSTTKGEGTAASGLYFVAMMAFGLAAFGYIQMSELPSGTDAKLFDVMVCNFEDVWLLGGTAVVLVLCGMMNTSSQQLIRD